MKAWQRCAQSCSAPRIFGVSGVPTVLIDGVPLFSGAIRAELMEAELRKAAGHVRR